MRGFAELLVSVAVGSWRAVRTALVGLGVAPRVPARQAALWREAAGAAGLAAVEVTDESLAGWVGRLRVRLGWFGSGGVYGTRISISGPGLSAEVTLQPEGLGGSGRVAREIEVGDEEFDRATWVEGPPAVVRSLLDADTRRQVRALFEGRLERRRLAPFWAAGRIDAGVLRVDVPAVAPPPAEDPAHALLSASGSRLEAPAGSCVGGLERLPDVLRLVVALARRLETPPDVPRRLAETLRSEPVAGVRLQCLATLAREFPRHEATREALLAAREDPDAEVRLRAGIFLGPEGRDVVLAIAGGEGAPDEITARAVAELGAGLSVDEATGLLHSALRTRRLATAAECLGALARRGGPQAVRTLAKVLAVEGPELAASAADALGVAGDVSAEPALLAALGAGDATVRAAATRALGRVGTIAAVPPLKDLEEGDRACRAAARQAVAEIQSRLAGAEPGQLSLAAGESGRLSLADAGEGQLSLAERGSPSRPGPRDAAHDTPGPSRPGQTEVAQVTE